MLSASDEQGADSQGSLVGCLAAHSLAGFVQAGPSFTDQVLFKS